MAKLYETTVINTGGRAGEVYSDDQSFQYKIAAPTLEVEGATNPEQLFAAGYGACFNGAVEVVLVQAKVKEISTITATVTLNQAGKTDFFLTVLLEGHIDNLPLEQTQDYLEQAHQICPYSKATRDNIEVTIKAV